MQADYMYLHWPWQDPNCNNTANLATTTGAMRRLIVLLVLALHAKRAHAGHEHDNQHAHYPDDVGYNNDLIVTIPWPAVAHGSIGQICNDVDVQDAKARSLIGHTCGVKPEPNPIGDCWGYNGKGESLIDWPHNAYHMKVNSP